MQKDFSILYGIMAGDGCISRSAGKYFISVVGHHHDDRQFFDSLVIPIIRNLANKEIKYRIRQDQGKIEINFTNKELFKMFEKSEFPVGKKGTRLHIPEIFADSMNYVIAGYFATDGSIVLTDNNGILYPRLEFRSISQTILKQTQKHLEILGIHGKIYTFKPENFNIAYRLQINGLRNLLLFESNIGFLNPKHKVKFASFIEGRSSSEVERYTFQGDAHKAQRL